MILGRPENLDDYICVTSDISIMLHELGFIPLFREIDNYKIYYIKSKDLENIVKEVMD